MSIHFSSRLKESGENTKNQEKLREFDISCLDILLLDVLLPLR